MSRLILSLVIFFAVQQVYGQSPLFRDNAPKDPVKLDANMTKADFVPGVILVKFKDGTSVVPGDSQGLKKTGLPSVDAIFREYSVTSVAQVFKGAEPLAQKQVLKSFNGYTFERPSLNNIYQLTVKDPLKQFDAIQALKSDPNVVYAEPDYIYSIVDDRPESGVITPQGIQQYLNEHEAGGPHYPKSPSAITPNDPLYSQQWAIPAVHADAVWDTTTGDSSQIIAFLDTGVDWHHPDLADNIWTNTAEADGVTGLDDDNDGYVDDVHGWDFINNDNDPSDDNSHGTHVAGIACAVGNNGIGIAGVDWHAKIMPIKVFQSSGRGDVATITQGIYYAVKKGATVINMSFGSYAESLTMENALEYAYAQCVLVAAAGNDGICIGPGSSCQPFYPAALSYVLGVQATGVTGDLAGFSNFDQDGPVYSKYPNLLNYEMRAPGDGLISTIPGGNYRVYSGTSMATPVVSGAVALYQQLYPGLSQEQMWGNLINTTSGNMNIFAALSVHPNPQLWFVSNTIVDTLAGDNNNGMVDAGETVQLWFAVRNTWGQSDSVFVGLRLGEFEDTSVAHVMNLVAFVGRISPYAQRTDELDPFDIKISPSVTHDRDIVFDAMLWYAGSADTVHQRLVLTANHGQYLAGVMDSAMTLTADRLWIVYSSFRIGSAGYLYINPGTIVKNSAGIVNNGQLISQGTKDSMVVIQGPGGFNGTGVFTFNYTTLEGQNCSIVFGDWFTPQGDYRFVHSNLLDMFGAGTIFATGNLVMNESVVEGCASGPDAFWGMFSPYTKYSLNIERSNIINDNFVSSNVGVIDLSRFSSFKFNNVSHIDPVGPVFGGMFSISQSLGLNQASNNFIGFTGPVGRTNFGSDYMLEAIGTADIIQAPYQYWGTTDSSKIENNMVIDFWKNATKPEVNFRPILSAPSDSAHGIVWKVLVDGIDPQDQKNLMNPIGVGPHRFDVYFNRPMDTTYTPQLSFGVRDPYSQQAVTDSAHWSDSARVWTGWKTVKLYTGDGINTIRVAAARDPEGFEIPVEDMRFSFLIDAAGTSSEDFVATPGLGKVQLSWVRPDMPDVMGYNMYRFNSVTDTTYSDTTLISTKLVTDTTYTDFNVTPGTNYYYSYKVVRTDFTESDYSKFVGTKALTSKPGDANGDFNVDVLDVIADVAYIMGQNPQPFIFAASDVNGDSTINVLDVIGTINLILHPTSATSKAVVASSTSSESADKEATINLVGDKVWLNSPASVYGIELTIAGCKDADDLSNLNGLSGLEVSTAKLKGDTAIVLAYSMKGNFIPEGKIALVQTSAKGISLVSAVLSSADGKEIASKVYNNGVPTIPETFTLFQNYPNPFNPTTTIRYGLPKDVNGIQVVIYNILGQQVKSIEQGQQTKGYHEVIWNGRNANGVPVASGVYFCQFRVRENNALRIIGITKMMLLK